MKALSVVLFVAIISACAQFGVVPAKSFDEQLGYAYTSVASVRESAANALTTGVIKVEDAQQVQTLADQARLGLDSARVAKSTGDTTTAIGRLQLANNILLQLAQYLQTRGVK